MTQPTPSEIAQQFDFRAELERRITYREGPLSELKVEVQGVRLEAPTDHSLRLSGRLLFELRVGDGDAAMRSSGDPPFTLEVPTENGDARLERATLHVAGFAAVDLTKDRADFEAALERALLEVTPRDGETWAEALIRHDGGAAVGAIGRRPSYALSLEALRPSLARLRDGLRMLRERAFAEDSELEFDESEGWTGSALDVLAHHLGEPWRPTTEEHVAVLDRLTEIHRAGDEAARAAAFEGASSYNATVRALRALSDSGAPSGSRAVEALREATAPHKREGLAGMLNDMAADWMSERDDA